MSEYTYNGYTQFILDCMIMRRPHERSVTVWLNGQCIETFDTIHEAEQYARAIRPPATSWEEHGR